MSYTLAGKEHWKPRQVQKEVKPEEACSLNGKSGPLGPWLHEPQCWLGFKWAAREISSNPEDSRASEALITDRLSHPAGLAGRLSSTPPGRNGELLEKSLL